MINSDHLGPSLWIEQTFTIWPHSATEKLRTGSRLWRHQSGYYLQSHVENTIYRFKRIIGGRLRCKHTLKIEIPPVFDSLKR
jgi:hypothetical protein